MRASKEETETRRCGRVRTLRCACCGGYTRGRQWYNRDKGFGVCVPCVDWMLTKPPRMDAEEIERMYGRKGEHWGIIEDAAHEGVPS